MEETQQKHFGKWMLRSTLAFAGVAGAIWALAGIGENDSDKDGWSDEEEILAGTNPFDETEPWDSDDDGIADYLEFQNGTDPLDAGDPPKSALAGSAVGVASLSQNRSGTEITSAETTLSPQPTITPAEPFPANATQGETSATLRLEGGTATGPGFKGTYDLSVPVGNYYKIELSADDIATVECDGMEVRSEWIPAEKRIRSGEGVSTYRDIADLNGTRTFPIAYENKGGPYVLSVTITSVRAEIGPMGAAASLAQVFFPRIAQELTGEALAHSRDRQGYALEQKLALVLEGVVGVHRS